jgi:hypothetical protein
MRLRTQTALCFLVLLVTLVIAVWFHFSRPRDTLSGSDTPHIPVTFTHGPDEVDRQAE